MKHNSLHKEILKVMKGMTNRTPLNVDFLFFYCISVKQQKDDISKLYHCIKQAATVLMRLPHPTCFLV